MSGAQLVRYDAMVYAIAECHRVDEVKEIHDKARALEVYAKQAMNVDAERKATEIRLRAERRAGELLAKMKRKDKKANLKKGPTRNDDASGNSEYSDALTSAGVNRRTAERWQELAAAPKKQFDDALRDPEKKPTTSGILAASKPAPKMDNDALWLWGRLRDFWLAAGAYNKMDPSKRSPLLVKYAARLALRKMAATLCREEHEKHEAALEGWQVEMFELQKQYPAKRGTEIVYVAREDLTLAERQWNIERLRKESASKAKHADALQAETDALIAQGYFEQKAA